MKLSIRQYPDVILRQCAQPVQEVDREIERLVSYMFIAMHDASGIGLAAPQVGISKRVIIADVDHVPSSTIVLINPVIQKAEGKIRLEEGCLSIPGLRAIVERAERIEIEGLNGAGNPISFKAEGLLSVCLQHEIDHLDGYVFLDRISPVQRARLLRKYQQATLAGQTKRGRSIPTNLMKQG